MTKRYADGRGNPPGSPWRNGGPAGKRHTVELRSRVPHGVRELLEALASAEGCSLSDAVASAIVERCRVLGVGGLSDTAKELGGWEAPQDGDGDDLPPGQYRRLVHGEFPHEQPPAPGGKRSQR